MYGADAAAASLIAVIPLTLVSRLFAILLKTPVTVFLLTGIFPLVPGAGIYYTAYYCIVISGAKNAALGILAASIMTDEEVVIENLPDVRDINVLLEAIQEIGAQVDRIDRHTVKINGSTIHEVSVDDEYIRRIRASYYFIGALLGKYKSAQVPLPGGPWHVRVVR